MTHRWVYIVDVMTFGEFFREAWSTEILAQRRADFLNERAGPNANYRASVTPMWVRDRRDIKDFTGGAK